MQKSPKLKADSKSCKKKKKDKKAFFLLENYHDAQLTRQKGVLKFSIMVFKKKNAPKREESVQENGQK